MVLLTFFIRIFNNFVLKFNNKSKELHKLKNISIALRPPSAIMNPVVDDLCQNTDVSSHVTAVPIEKNLDSGKQKRAVMNE